MAPGVPTLLYCRLRYLMDSHVVKAALILSALGDPKAFPWRFRLSILVHFSRSLAKIYMPTSVI